LPGETFAVVIEFGIRLLSVDDEAAVFLLRVGREHARDQPKMTGVTGPEGRGP
jgi:hypothetical protein